MIENINDSVSDSAPVFVLDNENAAALPQNELPEVGMLTKTVAQKNAKTFTVFFNRGLGGLGNFIGKKPSANYKLDAQETVIFEESLTEFLLHNGLTILSPNLIFLFTVLVIVAPKFALMYTDWRDGAAPAPVPPAPAKKGETKSETANTTPATEWTAETAAKYAENLPKPSDKEEALKIEEIGLQRGTFKLVKTENGAVAYYGDVLGTYIKNNQYDKTKNGYPSKWFQKLLLQLEADKVPVSMYSPVLKNYVKSVHKKFNITKGDVNALRGKANI